MCVTCLGIFVALLVAIVHMYAQNIFYIPIIIQSHIGQVVHLRTDRKLGVHKGTKRHYELSRWRRREKVNYIHRKRITFNGRKIERHGKRQE